MQQYVIYANNKKSSPQKPAICVCGNESVSLRHTALFSRASGGCILLVQLPVYVGVNTVEESQAGHHL